MRQSDYQAILRDDVITTRQDRYVIQVRASGSGKSVGLVHDWSKTGQTAYIEPLETIDDNNRLNYLKAQEREEAERILLELTGQVRALSADLLRDGERLSFLDSVFAAAKTARDFNCSRPDYEPGKGFRLTALRHPLLEERLASEGRQSTPVNVTLTPQEPMLVISGLNAGGKTTALKACGLACLTAKTGLFVHAREGSAMELPAEVLSVMGDSQDLESGLSTFSGHIRALTDALGRAGRGSLILLDEVGGGTDPQEGAALALSVLGHLLKAGAYVVSATHFHLVKAWAVLTDGVASAAVGASGDGAPSYALSYGPPGFSGGLKMAERLGLPAHLVRDAEGRLDEGYRSSSELMEKLDSELSRLKLEREGLEAERRSLRAITEKHNEEHAREMERLKKAALAKDQEIKMALGRFRRESEELKKEYQRSVREGSRSGVVALNVRRKELEKSLEAARPRFSDDDGRAEGLPEELTAGDAVFVKILGRRGTIVSWNNEKGEGTVESKGVRVRAGRAGLGPAAASDAPRGGAVLNVIASPAGSDFSALKLLGFTVDEALLEIEREIDRAVLSGRKTLTIIHGLGTGRLKSGIANFLKKHPRVVEFKSPTDVPGGSGVTEVVLDS
jgi:DNA mismatch repair protein MutS2